MLQLIQSDKMIRNIDHYLKDGWLVLSQGSYFSRILDPLVCSFARQTSDSVTQMTLMRLNPQNAQEHFQELLIDEGTLE